MNKGLGEIIRDLENLKDVGNTLYIYVGEISSKKIKTLKKRFPTFEFKWGKKENVLLVDIPDPKLFLMN